MNSYGIIYDLIRKIPKGKVATYGQVAQLAGMSGPRRTAYALRILEDKTVPWHRVINAQGKISRRNIENMNLQRKLLIKEGIIFSKNGRVDLTIFRCQIKANI